MCVRLMIRKELEMMALEAQVMSGVQAMMQPPPEQAPQGQPQRPTNRSATINGTRRWAAVAIKASNHDRKAYKRRQAMPPKSKAQSSLIPGRSSGIKDSAGLSPEEAKEYVSGYPTKKPPERKKPAPMKGKKRVA